VFDIINGRCVVSISSLAKEALFFFQVHSHAPEKQQASFQTGNFWKSKASTKEESIPLHHTHTHEPVLVLK
jgi:hypothetical protein